jgi:hypothetical protein
MQILTGLATLAFCVTGAVVGARLMWLWRRTRGLPEFAVGFALFVIGGVGYPMAMVGGTPDAVSTRTGVHLVAASTFVIDAGFIAIATFTWSVFRRGDTWARVLLGLLALGYLGQAIGIALASRSMASASEIMTAAPMLTIAGQLLNLTVFGWTAIEAYAYWWKLRKRAAIGLGDPVVTNRFLLWAMAASATLVTNGISWWVVLTGADFFQQHGAQAIIAVVSVLSCTCQYLAFLPPKAYLARLRAD